MSTRYNHLVLQLQLEQDFVSKYPGYERKLFENWPRFVENVERLSEIDVDDGKICVISFICCYFSSLRDLYY